MKRILFILAAAVMILPLSSSSCKKQDNPTEDVAMEPAKTADVAKVISFELVSGATPRYLNRASSVGHHHSVVHLCLFWMAHYVTGCTA